MLAFGLAFVAIAATTMVSIRRRRRTWLARRGTVIGSRLADVIDPVGRVVDVLVNPDDPTDAVVVKGATRPVTAAVAFMAFGVAASVLGTLLLAGAVR